MYKLEITIMKKGTKTFTTTFEHEDINVLKNSFLWVVQEALEKRNVSDGYFDAEMLISKDDGYFDSDAGFFAYVDGEVKVAPVVGLRIFGKSNLTNPAIDYIEVEMPDGKLVTFDWETSYWDGEYGNESFCIELPNTSTVDETFIDGDILKNIKAISSTQVYSHDKIDSPTFSIDKIEILEDCVTVGEITKPEVKEIVYEF